MRQKRFEFGQPNRFQRRAVLCVFAVLSFYALGAKQTLSPNDLIREANAAFQSMNYEAALSLYQDAEERGSDPGLIAFNKATALYHLQRYDEADQHYRRVLDDDEISAERRAKALYNLGNCLVQEALPKDTQRTADQSQLTTLKSAIVTYELCLEVLAKDDALRNDAQNNLELAKLLWSKARKQSKDKELPTPNDGPEPETPKSRPPETAKKDPKAEDGNNPSQQNPNKQENGSGQKKNEADQNDKKAVPEKTDRRPPPGAGKMPVIGDPGEIEKLSLEDLRKLLEKTEKRLIGERQSIRQSAGSDPRRAIEKDW